MKNSLSRQRRTKLFHRLLLQAILTFNDPFWQRINITYLKLVDAHNYHIFYTVFGSFNLNVAQKKLLAKVPYLKRAMLKKWNYHYFPNLVFSPDQNLLNAEKINQILKNTDEH